MPFNTCMYLLNIYMPLQYIYVPLEEKREWILIKSHPLTPQLSAQLFAQKGIGAL